MGKLIRDQVPDLVRAAGGEISTVELTGAELLTALRAKVLEEAGEVAEATTRDALVEELADLREVLDRLAALEGIGDDEVRDRADAKRRTHGGFEHGLFTTSYRP